MGFGVRVLFGLGGIFLGGVVFVNRHNLNALLLPRPDIHIVALIHCHAFQIADSHLSEL